MQTHENRSEKQGERQEALRKELNKVKNFKIEENVSINRLLKQFA